MKNFIVTSQDFINGPSEVPDGLYLVSFQLVGIGINTQAECDHSPQKIHEVVRKQPCFYIVSEDLSELRTTMHDLVDRFCDLQEGNQNESEK